MFHLPGRTGSSAFANHTFLASLEVTRWGCALRQSGLESFAKIGEGRIGIQPLGKIMDKGFHRRMPEAVETEKIHFFHGLFGGPFFNGHAVGGDKYPGAIVAKTAVHENFLR